MAQNEFLNTICALIENKMNKWTMFEDMLKYCTQIPSVSHILFWKLFPNVYVYVFDM